MNPELLLPAGDLTALRTAVDNGADAVYVGAASFSARKSAVNFSEDELQQAVIYAHERSARIYLALNTLIADEELPEALATAGHAASCGVDAMIVQDLGLAELIHRLLPAMPLHASTQMTIYDESAFHSLHQAGIRRIILPRELSLPEVARMTAAAHEKGLETEMFIHGALCVCFSGQCLFSSLMGGRSGNRGSCAQPCRLTYRISEDGRQLQPSACLSPRDQAAFRHLDGIRQTAVDALKIEGRMRSAAYVGQTAATYRALLDGRLEADENLETAAERLLLTFNRGGSFTDRAFSGKRDRSFLSGSTTGSFGILIGTVADVRPQAGILNIQSNPTASAPGKGDILSVRRLDQRTSMDPPDLQSEVASAPIGTVLSTGQQLQVRGFHPDALSRLQPGDFVYRMNDARQDQGVLSAKNRRTPIELSLTESTEAVRLTACVSQGLFAGLCAETEMPSDHAQAQPLAAERVKEQLAKTGGTPFLAANLTVPAPVSLSISGLNQLRRSALQALSERLAQQQRQIMDAAALAVETGRLESMLLPLEISNPQASRLVTRPHLAAFFHQWPASDDPIACGADVYLLPAAGLESVYSRLQLAELRSAEPAAVLVLVLPPAASGLQATRIHEWQADETFLQFDRISGGHPGVAAIAAKLGIGFETDSTANIYNHLSLQRSMSAGAAATCISPELSEKQLLRLAAFAGRDGQIHSSGSAALTDHRTTDSHHADPADGHRLEWFVYGRHRLMYSAFCPVGQNAAGCNRCTGHQYVMTDRKDRTLPLLLHPPYCTSTILHADAIKPPSNLAALIEHAPARLRLQFFNERQPERKREITRLRSVYGSSRHESAGKTGE